MISRFKNPALLALVLVAAASCARSPAPSFKTLEDADKQFLEICHDELKQPGVRLSRLENTIWVYVPLTDTFLNVKATKDGAVKSGVSHTGWEVKFLDSTFDNDQSTFTIEYDFAKDHKYLVSPGYEVKYGEIFSRLQQSLMQAILRTYAETDEESKDGQENRPVHVPDFFVLVIADTVNGIASELIFYYPDLKGAMSPAGPTVSGEEFQKRISSRVYGDEGLIRDSTGRSLNIREITWGEFLSKQIENRLNFLFTISDFKPDDDILDEILKTVRLTTHYYGFKSYSSLILNDLRNEKSLTVSREKLEELKFPEE